MTDQPEKLDLNSMDLTAEKKEDLLRLFPEIRTEDGRIDFERLKLALGETVDVGKERYGMSWPGKADCFRAIQTPSSGTLLPCPEESWPPKPYFRQRRGEEEDSRGERGGAEKEEVHAEARRRGEEREASGAGGDAEVEINDSENLIIEGDNLEVLKLLQKAYLGKVKMIYIDPPYNTGNDFIYPDNYSESMQTYLEYTGQVDGEGRRFGTNSDTDGRFHSRWMNMMYPRLYLARNLLREDGVIFISIDDNEVENLRKLCDEIFGEESFIAQLVWKSRQNKDNRNVTGVSIDHEYVITYGQKLRGTERKINQYSNPDNDPRGLWVSGNMVGLLSEEKRPNCHYDLINPVTGIIYSKPRLGWRYDKNTMERLIQEDRIIWPSESNGRPRRKVFLNELKDEYTGFSSIIGSNVYTRNGTEIIDVLFSERVVEFPKPVELIQELMKQCADETDSIILDFFAGSGTTAQAALELNKQDNKNRKFILVQLPEPTCREDYPTIADITKERVRRVIQKIKGEAEKAALADKKKQPDLFSSAASAAQRAPDPGFRVFKLAESNFKAWNARAPQDAAALAKQLELHIDHIREERRADDILYEILLKSGFQLTTPVEILTLAQGETEVAGFVVDGGRLLICLDEKLTMEAVQAMADLKPERVVCLDKGFEGNDQLKTNAVHIFRNAGIASFKTV